MNTWLEPDAANDAEPFNCSFAAANEAIVSDQDIGKKMVEQMDLDLFAAAYAHVTGRSLVTLRSGERPDFVCCWGKAKPVGVELTFVPIGPFGVSFSLYDVASDKAKKMRAPGWTLPDRTVLVLMVEEPVSKLSHEERDQLLADFKLGFLEVWVADRSDLDAYGNVELFGLYPRRWFGAHRRPNWYSKPYG